MNYTTYWVIIWREKEDWGWLHSLDGNEQCTTQDALDRLKFRTREAAMADLWTFRSENSMNPTEVLHLVKVTSRRRIAVLSHEGDAK
jgi:hypothetical protein